MASRAPALAGDFGDYAEAPERHQRFGPAKTMLGTAAALSMLVPPQLVALKMRPDGSPRLPKLFHRLLSRALGIRTTMHGTPVRGQGVLFVVNHLSWADIPVLGSKLLGHFVAKSEVGAMGPVGWLAGLQNTIYVERDRRQATGEQRDAIATRLAAGGNVILFAEGTTGDGVGVLPFKSSLFAVADGLDDVLIQPVTLAYTRVNGLPLRRAMLPHIAWTGDMTLGPHAFDFMRLGRVEAQVRLHPGVRAADFADRKALARHCEAAVAAGYSAAMREVSLMPVDFPAFA
ncbi:lysophospholipid acyltransferase family protein [Sphingoaurantiacus capsulatus]|uniref:Lysophospholipid acyltransferase family protein n=1 Tax=Sphingoaurantiacus capsulatus TaxID=1771310 RepID=A0ABV7XH29_9SPHN